MSMSVKSLRVTAKLLSEPAVPQKGSQLIASQWPTVTESTHNLFDPVLMEPVTQQA